MSTAPVTVAVRVDADADALCALYAELLGRRDVSPTDIVRQPRGRLLVVRRDEHPPQRRPSVTSRLTGT
ncbi:MAG: hypothetical protein WKF73_02965 [Nocardioidaceae bacterium]